MKQRLKWIGNRVKFYRKYYYASLPLAAKSAGISKSLWWKVEQGKTNFSYATIWKINQALFGTLRGEIL